MSPSNKYVQDDSFIVEVWFKEIDVVKWAHFRISDYIYRIQLYDL